METNEVKNLAMCNDICTSLHEVLRNPLETGPAGPNGLFGTNLDKILDNQKIIVENQRIIHEKLKYVLRMNGVVI